MGESGLKEAESAINPAESRRKCGCEARNGGFEEEGFEIPPYMAVEKSLAPSRALKHEHLLASPAVSDR